MIILELSKFLSLSLAVPDERIFLTFKYNLLVMQTLRNFFFSFAWFYNK